MADMRMFFLDSGHAPTHGTVFTVCLSDPTWLQFVHTLKQMCVDVGMA